MTDIAALLERVRAATGPDREMDSDIGFELGWFPQGRDHYEWIEADGTFVQSVNPKPFTASIDAALALVERICPDLVIKFTRIGDGSGHLQVTEAWLGESGVDVVDDDEPLEPMPGALAIIAALLSALTASEQSND